MAPSPLQHLGENIRRLRLAKGLSQEALAARSNSHRNYVGAVERGERNPTVTKVLAIAAALECDPAELLVGLGRPAKRSQK